MTDETLQQIRTGLEERIATFHRVVVAFSAGVDSAVVAAAAHAALGERALMITAVTETLTEEDRLLAAALASDRGWRQEEIDYSELAIPGYAENPANRCYHCKSALYDRLSALASERGLGFVLDGSNADDLGDYRPGRAAAIERGVRSPLAELGIDKKSVRALARLYGLENHDKPSAPCLSSRVPYGTPITREILEQIDRAERALRSLGFTELRVRHHGEVARVELPREEFLRGVELAGEIDRALVGAGYRYVALDLRGFRSGSLNETLVQIELTHR